MMDFSKAAYRVLSADTSEIKQTLIDTLESWLPSVLPGGKTSRGQFRAGSLNGEAGQSLTVQLNGSNRGLWMDFATGESGDVFALLMGVYDCDFPGAIDAASNLCSIPAVARKPSPRAENSNDFYKNELMPMILRGCTAGLSAVERYLAKRGLKPQGNDLLEHPDLLHVPTQTGWPAMVAKVRDVNGNVIGLHRTYIDPDADAKAAIDPNKMMVGYCSGGAVRLGWSDNDGYLGVCEGIETGLAAMRLYGGLPVWAALSTSGMHNIDLPKSVKTIVILGDNDPEGVKAAQELAKRLVCCDKTLHVKMARPKQGYKDFNDELLGTTK
jgi:putative DNA primase/helicase